MFNFFSKKEKKEEVVNKTDDKVYVGREGLSQVNLAVNNISSQVKDIFPNASLQQIENFKEMFRKSAINSYKNLRGQQIENGSQFPKTFGHTSTTYDGADGFTTSFNKELRETGIMGMNELSPRPIKTVSVDIFDEPVSQEQIDSIDERLNNVCNWIKENPDTDPNTYEMSSIFMDVSKLSGNIQESTKENIQYMKEKRFTDLKDRLGLDENTDLYKLQSKLYDAAINGEPVTFDSRVQEYICKCSSVSLYIAQEKNKDENFKYNNPTELKEMQEMREYCNKEDIVIPQECEKFNNWDRNGI
jgi:hypothetical protein